MFLIVGVVLLLLSLVFMAIAAKSLMLLARLVNKVRTYFTGEKDTANKVPQKTKLPPAMAKEE